MAKNKKKPRVHEDLDGLNISIDALGEMSSNTNIDKINSFLNKNLEDKKLDNKPQNSPTEKPKK